MKSIVEQSHEFLSSVLHKGAICVDGTLGHGKDTKFFLDHKVRKVIGFEIQEEVFNNTVSKIEDIHFTGVLDGHENMDKYVDEAVDAIIFNFGFCPNSNSPIKTLPDTSLIAIQKGLSLLKKKGRMALVMYPHKEGKDEARLVEEMLSNLSANEFYIEKRTQLNQNNSPYLIGIEKLK